MSLTEKLNRLVAEVRAAKATTKKKPAAKKTVRKKASPKNDVTDILIVGKKFSAAIKTWLKTPNKKTKLAMDFEFEEFENAMEYAELVEGSAIESFVYKMANRTADEGDSYSNTDTISPAYIKELDKFLVELPRIKAGSKVKKTKNDITMILEKGERFHAAMIQWMKDKKPKPDALFIPFSDFARILDEAPLVEGSDLEVYVSKMADTVYRALKVYNKSATVAPAFSIKVGKFLKELPSIQAK